MRLGILGGTFDPVHIGHLILAEEARLALELERVLFVPAGDPWRKAGRELSPRQDRLAMVRLAVADTPYFAVSTLEIERPGPSYAVDTLAALSQEWGRDSELFLVMGQDSLADLPHWHEPQRIIALARLAVAARPGWEQERAAALERALPGVSERLVWVDMPLIEISSTAVRERIGRGLPIRYWVPAAVEEYIRQQRLYVKG